MWDLWGIHYSLGPYKMENILPDTTIHSVCHHTGAEVTTLLRQGRVAHSSHPEHKVVFSAPLREWYNDLVAT